MREQRKLDVSLKIDCWGKYFDVRQRRYQVDRENFITPFHQTNQEKLRGHHGVASIQAGVQWIFLQNNMNENYYLFLFCVTYLTSLTRALLPCTSITWTSGFVSSSINFASMPGTQAPTSLAQRHNKRMGLRFFTHFRIQFLLDVLNVRI